MNSLLVIALAGPNGAGKSTAAPYLFEEVGIADFVNADVIARGLSAGRHEMVAMEAGRMTLRRLDGLAAQRLSFAFETTLASRTFAPWLKRLIAGGYGFRLVFLSLPSADAAVARVAERVRRGDHSVPEETVRRRYEAGLPTRAPRIVAYGNSGTVAVLNTQVWSSMEDRYGRS